MAKETQKNQSSPESISSILERIVPEKSLPVSIPEPEVTAKPTPEKIDLDDSLLVGKKHTDLSSYYDFDLAEFPWCIFSRSDRPKNRDPIVYTDTIKNPISGEPVTRTFKTFPGIDGYPTESTYQLAYILIQKYIEQGTNSDKVIFRTLRQLTAERGLKQGDGAALERTKRDLKILGSMSIYAENAFWDPEHNCYETLENFRFFEASHFWFNGRRGRRADNNQLELPISFIEVSQTFRKIAQSRGFFALGFKSDIFFKLKPLEQRLAIFLSRRFIRHNFVKREINQLARTLPINVKDDFNKRKRIKALATSLIEKDFPLLKSFSIEKKNGKWIAEFTRKAKPTPERPIREMGAAFSLTDTGKHLVEEIIKLTHEPQWYWWWTVCISKLGEQSIFAIIANYKELYVQGSQEIKTGPGAVLTDMMNREAARRGITLSKH